MNTMLGFSAAMTVWVSSARKARQVNLNFMVEYFSLVLGRQLTQAFS